MDLIRSLFVNLHHLSTFFGSTQMPPLNLATCFSPNLFEPAKKGSDPMLELSRTGTQTQITRFLIENAQVVFS